MYEIRYKDKSAPERHIVGLGNISGSETLTVEDSALEPFTHVDWSALGIEVKKVKASKATTAEESE